MPTPLPRPPFDPELEAELIRTFGGTSVPSHLPEGILAAREAAVVPSIEEVVAAHPGVTYTEHTVPGHGGAEIGVVVFSPADPGPVGTQRPAIFHIHGGGMIFGDRRSGAETCAAWVEALDVVVANVDYRLAPEHPDPVPVEDCHAALTWFVDHAAELGVDPSRVVVGGGSAGGGLSAGVALLARDRGGPALAGQLLMCPMLDDRNDSCSAQQFDGIGLWDRTSNETGWRALLGERKGTDAVSVYAAPARELDLSGLPPAFIDVGSAEVFRDEDVAYAQRIWACGGVAELHVWPGGYHGYFGVAPEARLSRLTTGAVLAWLRHVVGPRRDDGATRI